MSQRRSESVRGPGEDLEGTVVQDWAWVRSQVYLVCWSGVRAGCSLGRLVCVGARIGVLRGVDILVIRVLGAVAVVLLTFCGEFGEEMNETNENEIEKSKPLLEPMPLFTSVRQRHSSLQVKCGSTAVQRE